MWLIVVIAVGVVVAVGANLGVGPLVTVRDATERGLRIAGGKNDSITLYLARNMKRVTLVETDNTPADAKKRLEAIQNLEELGSGFFLALHDLEIRGAGEVLGESQSGEMLEVGFQLYTDMLSAAVNALKAGRVAIAGAQLESGEMAVVHLDPSGNVVVDGKFMVP